MVCDVGTRRASESLFTLTLDVLGLNSISYVSTYLLFVFSVVSECVFQESGASRKISFCIQTWFRFISTRAVSQIVRGRRTSSVLNVSYIVILHLWTTSISRSYGTSVQPVIAFLCQLGR